MVNAQNIKDTKLSISDSSSHRIAKVISGLNSRNKKLQDRYIKQEQNFDQERKGWDRDRKKWSKKLGEVVAENQNLQFEHASKAISLANFKSDIDIKSKEIITLRSMKEILENRLTSAQNDAVSTQEKILKKESEIASLKSKIAELERSSCQGIENIKSELESKVNELECPKSEAISKPVVGGDVEEQSSIVSTIKNISNSSNISAVSEPSHLVTASDNKNLSKYFIRRKNTLCEEQSSMDQAEKIDGNTLTHTSDEISEPSKNNTEISPKGTSINEISEDLISRSQDSKSQDSKNRLTACSAIEIPNITPYLAQPENNSRASAKAHMSSLIESNSQTPIEGIGSIPIVACILLALLIIAVMWFVRRTWNIGKKRDRLQDAWTRY